MEVKQALDQENQELALIAKFPKSGERRVISFGLYGKLDKYNKGAIMNADIAPVKYHNKYLTIYIMTIMSCV
jgi:hypothetical protein